MQLSNLLNKEKLVEKREIQLQMEKLTLRKFHGICLVCSYLIKLSSHLYSDIKSKKSLKMAFLNRQSERISLSGGRKELDWQLNVAAGSENLGTLF